MDTDRPPRAHVPPLGIVRDESVNLWFALRDACVGG
jgi:hypothetical protein